MLDLYLWRNFVNNEKSRVDEFEECILFFIIYKKSRKRY